MLKMTCKLSGLLLIGCMLSGIDDLFAQERDTLDFYKRIRKSAYKRKATKLLYQAIFVDPVPQQYEDKPLSDEQKQTDPNGRYEGKIIKDIRVIVYDPFGYSVNDTFTRNINKLQKAGNSVHITTRQRVIRNMLLIRIHDTIALIRLTESERLVRQAGYINDARITVIGDTLSDSAIVVVRVLDKWNYDAAVSAGTQRGYIRIRDRNLSGWGQTYEQRIGYDMATGYDLRGNYHITNIKHTYISSNLFYATTKEETRTGLSFNRPFYSPLARWAGGAEGSRVWGRYKYSDTIEPKLHSLPLHYYLMDFWSAKSFALGKQKKTEKNSNIIIGARYASTRYLQRPAFHIDTNFFNVNTDLYLGSIGYSLRKYYKDQFIYRFGANEDVPEGLLLQATFGVIEKEFIGVRYYSGFEISNGRHLKNIGYLSANFNYGTYYRIGVRNNSTINSGIFYFTDLYQKGRWYFRNFISYKFIHGLHKMPYERITLKSGEMYGFNPGDLNGTGKMILTMEGVAYAPYNIIGFKFAPIVLAAWGILENDRSRFLNGKIYQAYSVGLLLRNENLLNSSFEFTVGFYPELPGPESRRDVFKINPVGSFSLKVRSFDISKPGTVAFD
jgi:hypothetical protein